MDYKYLVFARNRETIDPDARSIEYSDELVYHGNHLVKAIKAMRAAKKVSGYVVIEWR